MDLIEAVQSRRSIRGFKPDPVPREVLSEILKIASRAPSAMNTQPWEITVLTGQVLEDIKRGTMEMLKSGAPPVRDVPGHTYDGVYKQRQVELAIGLFQLLGIAREDKEKRTEWMQRGFRQFDAPAAIIIVQDESLTGSGPLMDIGSVMQSICLAAVKHGLGTCIAKQGVYYPGVLRKIAGIPESKKIVIAIAIGYPDWDFPANAVETERESVEEITTWVGF